MASAARRVSAWLQRKPGPPLLHVLRPASTNANVPSFKTLSEGTSEDYAVQQRLFAVVASPEAITERLCAILESMRGLNIGNPIDLYEHSLQTATRALTDGADDEMVTCALLHDIGELLAPPCHGEIASSLLRPYISPRNDWVLSHHEVFQAFYYGEAMGIDHNVRDRFSKHPHFSACEDFCQRYDQNSFDQTFQSLPIDEFKPIVARVISRKPYSTAEHLASALNAAKAALGVYDFKTWHENTSQ